VQLTGVALKEDAPGVDALGVAAPRAAQKQLDSDGRELRCSDDQT